LFIGQEDDYYPNIEIGAFLNKQDSNFNIGYNERFAVNEVNIKYDDFNQDKDDENTRDAVHTEMETVNANRNVQNEKEIDINFIRDPFLIATTQDKAASETSSSLTQDDKVFIFDVVETAPNQTRTVQRFLTHSINNDGNLQLLGSGFNWSILGFVVGDVFTINTTSNSGTYTVLEITSNIITLEIISASPTSIGRVITEFTYPLTNVQYILRTSENFDLIEGIESPLEYGNLRYTLKRNLLNYRGSYLKTATNYKSENINVTYLKNNVNLVTQFNGGEVISELDPITQEQLSNPLLTPRMITCKVLCTYEQYLDFKGKLETISDTDNYIKVIGGFVRVYDNENRLLKGFAKSSDFTWANGTMDFTLEEKWESDVTNITYDGYLYYINEVGYNLDGVTLLEYLVNDTNYIQFFDQNTRPLTNRVKFDLVSVNDVIYDSMTELLTAIELL
jgi:hypothetical protein